MKTLFNVKDVDLDAIRGEVIFLMEALGFECTRTDMPTVYISDEVEFSCYVAGVREIVLTSQVAGGDRNDLLITLAHELTHSLQSESILTPFGVPYHLRESEQQAYTVQKMYSIGLLAMKPLKPIWSFLIKYGPRNWYNQHYQQTGLWMQQEPSIRNHVDSQMHFENRLRSIFE